MTEATRDKVRSRGGIPRGLAATGPILFSYGFRPFFLGGAIWACLAMSLWIIALSGRIEAPHFQQVTIDGGVGQHQRSTDELARRLRARSHWQIPTGLSGGQGTSAERRLDASR